MRLRAALLATALTTTPVMAAMATTITGPYVDIGGGYDLTQTQHMHAYDGQGVSEFNKNLNLPPEEAKFLDSAVSPATHSRETMHHGAGWTGFASFGWGFGNGLRAEVEGAYNWSETTRYTTTSYGGGHGKTDGADRSYGGFVNVLYDIDLKRLFGIDVPVTPFIGVGAGYLWQTVNDETPIANSIMNVRHNGTNGSFAYQGIVGAAYDIPGVPGLQMTTEYRMIGQVESFNNGNLGQTVINPNNQPVTDHNSIRYDQRFNHQFIVGVRYAFNTAPPPPPPPPAPAIVPPAPVAARTYLVFFDWDGAALTPRARAIVAQAAQASAHVQTTRLEVNGYTDNSAAHPGPRGEKYNLGLSLHRADSVKAELIRDGVAASAIDIHGYGEARPLVPTGPDTREPQNRRVEIILH
ncbi:OmpA family protein [Komagataeibacter xylinus]|uniref:OmpA family protein n=1 Tax=Komagataeibacter xylinus TaxID=28448 RepID=UPI0010307909|nr:OmpA family protein [Komagataeibacter xylinus]